VLERWTGGESGDWAEQVVMESARGVMNERSCSDDIHKMISSRYGYDSSE
jgi:hypothetical protein